MSHDVIFALDVGTTKISIVAGRKNEHGKIEILGVGKVPSTGVSKGVVTNLEHTTQKILEAKQICEKNCGLEIKEVFAGVTSMHVKSIIKNGLLTRSYGNTEISREDVNKLIGDMRRIPLSPGDQILHIVPQEYKVDSVLGIQDPVGMVGVRLEGRFNIITAPVKDVRNLTTCVERAGMKIKQMILEPMASSEAVLNDEEKKAGVALVDIGGGTTDLCIYQNGILRKSVVIPFGGKIITEDIVTGCSILHESAEDLKVRFGIALADEVEGRRFISVRGIKGREPKEISERTLASIIQHRCGEIFEFVKREIQSSGYKDKLVAGMVLTGGASIMSNIKENAEFYTGIQSRIGMPTDILAHGYDQEICHPTYATALGLLISGVEVKETENLLEALQENDIPTEEILEESSISKKSFINKLKSILGPQEDTRI